MKILHALLTICVLSLGAAADMSAQVSFTFKRDNGVSSGHDSRAVALWEETVILSVNGPFTLQAIQVYYEGTTPGRDTIWIVGDPSEGALPPTSNVWSYNARMAPIIVDYDGVPGWDTIDVGSAGLHYDGYDRIVIQHRVSGDNGPWFAVDNAAGSFSVEYDPFTYPPGFPVQGQYYLASGDFLVRAVITFDFPSSSSGSSSKAAPPPTLVDIAKSAGIVDDAGKPLKSARVDVVDWNGDGWDDIAVGSSFFQNRKDGTFENVSGTIGIAASASVWGDYDNDGHIDCYAVNGGTGDRIYHNDGDGTFTDVTATSGLSNPYPTVMPIWFDFDHDGRLDLYIANGRTEQNGQEEYFPDQLWKGGGDGTFTRVTDESGINPPEKAGSPDGSAYLDCWGASPCDFDGDGWTDIFVATYRLAPDLLYRNRHDGTFEEVGQATGVRGEPTAASYYFGHGIGCDWGDYDGDGDPDVVVGNLGHPDVRGLVSNPSLIYRNDGGSPPHFTSVGGEMGLKFFEMNAGVVWLDLDLDGDLDLWHCQYAYNAKGTNGEPQRLSRMYLNGGASENSRLHDVTWSVGSLIHGAWTAARGDFDHDGDLDLVVASPTDAVKLFRNDVERRGTWLELRLQGNPDVGVSRDAYGTVVRLYAGGRVFYRDLQGGGSGATATQNSNELHFGLGPVASIDSMVVSYPGGASRTYYDVPTNRAFDVPYGGELRQTSGAPVVERSAGMLRIVAADYSDGAFTVMLCGGTASRRLTIDVTDGRGEIVASRIVDGDGDERVSLPCPAVPDGAYFVRVLGGGGAVVEKVSVVR
jgi:hypothetical protein